MNLVGKILVVALLVMALVFSSFTLAVHATHKNWKLMVDNPNPKPGEQPGYKQVLADRDNLITRLQTELTEKQKLLERTIRESEQRLGQLESHVQELLAARTKLQTEITEKTNALNTQVEAAKTSATVLENTQKENTALRAKNADLQKERDDALGSVITLEDALAQATGEMARLLDRNRILLAQAAQYRLALQDANVPVRVEVPTVFGVVTATHTGEKLVEINLGLDEGLRVGDKLHVYRFGSSAATTQYLGQIQLTRIDKSAAVGAIDPKTLRGTIQKDDHVGTRIE